MNSLYSESMEHLKDCVKILAILKIGEPNGFCCCHSANGNTFVTPANDNTFVTPANAGVSMKGKGDSCIRRNDREGAGMPKNAFAEPAPVKKGE